MPSVGLIFTHTSGRVVPTTGTKVGPDGIEEEEEENLKEKGG